MRTRRFGLCLAAGLMLLMAVGATSAFAQAPAVGLRRRRRRQPLQPHGSCKTFAGAISKTAAGGRSTSSIQAGSAPLRSPRRSPIYGYGTLGQLLPRGDQRHHRQRRRGRQRHAAEPRDRGSRQRDHRDPVHGRQEPLRPERGDPGLQHLGDQGGRERNRCPRDPQALRDQLGDHQHQQRGGLGVRIRPRALGGQGGPRDGQEHGHRGLRTTATRPGHPP